MSFLVLSEHLDQDSRVAITKLFSSQLIPMHVNRSMTVCQYV